MQKIVTTIYKTIDGKCFENEKGAVAHENKMNNVKVFEIYAGPDLTEGRHGPIKRGYLLVNANGYHEMFAEDWCYSKYKSKVAFVMGAYGSNAIIGNWKCELSTKQWNEIKEAEVLGKIEENFIEKLWGNT